MTLIRFSCPKCGDRLSIDEMATACAVTCPNCRNVIRPWGAELLDTVFSCPGCATVLVLDREHGGMRIICPNCRSTIQLPWGELELARLLESPREAVVASDPSRKRTTIRLTPEEVEMLTGIE